IADEHDVQETQVRALKDGAFDADARIALDDLREQTGIAVAPAEDGAEQAETLGGHVVALLTRVPQRGEIIADPSAIEFEILEADPRRVKRVRVRAQARPAPESR